MMRSSIPLIPLLPKIQARFLQLRKPLIVVVKTMSLLHSMEVIISYYIQQQNLHSNFGSIRHIMRISNRRYGPTGCIQRPFLHSDHLIYKQGLGLTLFGVLISIIIFELSILNSDFLFPCHHHIYCHQGNWNMERKNTINTFSSGNLRGGRERRIRYVYGTS